jgi:hypothetical protein
MASYEKLTEDIRSDLTKIFSERNEVVAEEGPLGGTAGLKDGYYIFELDYNLEGDQLYTTNAPQKVIGDAVDYANEQYEKDSGDFMDSFYEYIGEKGYEVDLVSPQFTVQV